MRFPDSQGADVVSCEAGSWPVGLPRKDGASALSGDGSIDTATTRLNGTSRTKNLIIEFQGGFEVLDELQNDVRTCLTHAVGNAFDNR
jgi:hypothetical protein